MGASGPVAHTRYLSADEDRTPASRWLREPAGGAAFRLMAGDRVGIRSDDKVGGVVLGGDFCLDLVQDMDSEVWAGSLAGKKWAVALLNRHALANAVRMASPIQCIDLSVACENGVVHSKARMT